MNKAKRTDVLCLNGKKITFVDLPDGYFYKGKYYTVAGCFKALEHDNQVETHKFVNGTWVYEGKTYHSLKDLYEWNEDEFGLNYSQLKKNYKTLGISFNPIPCTLYSYDKDEENELFNSKEQVIDELSFFMNDFDFLADTEEYEGFYLETLPEEETIKYLKKSIKNRIEILNQWRGI